MIGLSHKLPAEPWRARLTLPKYRISEAARYADLSSQTVAGWHAAELGPVSAKGKGESLSYLQLIELAVVAAFRKGKIKMRKIVAARSYIAKKLNSEYPFADYRFKTDGQNLILGSDQISESKGVVLDASSGGQLAWELILERKLQEFDYDEIHDLVLRWHVAGLDSSVIIDPRVSFGSPSVGGISTFALKNRYIAGYSVGEIADDYEITEKMVKEALFFEGLVLEKTTGWAN